MYKKQYFLYFIFTTIFSSCAENPNRVYFSINPEDRKIVIPVQLNDSITVNMAYNTPKTVKIGNTALTYNGVQIFNRKKALQTNDSEGILNIPQNDTSNVWEWNFEHNYLEIHPVEDFNMIFDTGAVDGAFRLDSTFVSAHPSLKPEIPPFREGQLGSAWGVYQIRGLFYDTILPVKLGNTTVNYNPISIYDMRKALGITWSDGIFNMPKNDTTYIWEWNFEHNYLKIHSISNFKIPNDCYLFSTKTHGYFANYIQLPMKIKFDNGDSLIINQTFWVDAGMPDDIAILPPSEEWQFLDKRDSSRIECKTDNIGRFYTVSATIFDNFSVDSMRLYIVDEPYSVPAQYIIGLNFLKRFNLFFDRKHHILGFQKIKKFQRLYTGEVEPYYFSMKQTGRYSFLVTRTANFDDNIYKTAGLREGDEIIGYNNVELKVMTNEQYLEIMKQNTIIYNIIRNGQSLKIVTVKNNREN